MTFASKFYFLNYRDVKNFRCSEFTIAVNERMESDAINDLIEMWKLLDGLKRIIENYRNKNKDKSGGMW